MKINSTKQLYDNLDRLFYDISSYCQECKYDDCMGMQWLLPGEARTLFKEGIPILTINENINLIHSFPEKNGIIQVDVFKPRCRLYKNGLCTIHSIRPLVCRLYPLGFAKTIYGVYLVLYEDCYYSEKLVSEKRDAFINSSIKLVGAINSGLLAKIINIYLQIENLCQYPHGPNNVTRLEMIYPADELAHKI